MVIVVMSLVEIESKLSSSSHFNIHTSTTLPAVQTISAMFHFGTAHICPVFSPLLAATSNILHTGAYAKGVELFVQQVWPIVKTVTNTVLVLTNKEYGKLLVMILYPPGMIFVFLSYSQSVKLLLLLQDVIDGIVDFLLTNGMKFWSTKSQDALCLSNSVYFINRLRSTGC